MGIIEPPPIQEADQPQAAPAAAAPQGAELGQMAYLDDRIQWANLSDTDLGEKAKTAYQDLMQQTGGTAQAVEAINRLEREGHLNAQIAQKFRESMIVANGNADRFAEDIVRQRQALQVAAAASPAQATTPGGASSQVVDANNPFAKMLNDPNNFFAQMMKFFASFLNIDLGGRLGQVQAQNRQTTAAPPAAAPSAAAPPPASAPPAAAPPAAAPIAPAAAASPDSAEAVAEVIPVRGGVAYDVSPLPGGESPGVVVADGSSNLGSVFGHNSDPPQSAITMRSGIEPPAQLQQASLTAGPQESPFRYDSVFNGTRFA